MAKFVVGETVKGKVSGMLYNILYLNPEKKTAGIQPTVGDLGGESAEVPYSDLELYKPFEDVQNMTDDQLKKRLNEIRGVRKIPVKKQKKAAKSKTAKPKKEKTVRKQNIPDDFDWG